jgi:hypothetical protein
MAAKKTAARSRTVKPRATSGGAASGSKGARKVAAGAPATRATKASATAKGNAAKNVHAALDKLAEQEDWHALERLLVETIQQGTAIHIEELAQADTVDDTWNGEQDAGAAVATALVERGVALASAPVLALAIRAAYHDPFELVRGAPDGTTSKKEQFVAGLPLAALRTAAANKAGPVRAAATYLIAHCDDATRDDLARLQLALEKEKHGDTRVALVLAIAILARRFSVPSGIRIEGTNVELAARAAVTRDPFTSGTVANLAKLLRKPLPLPSALGFRAGRTTNALLALALPHQGNDVVTALVEPIAADTDFKDLLLALAFPSPNLALVPARALSALQRTVLRGFASRSYEREHALRSQLGFAQPAEIVRYLDEAAPHWRPIDVPGHPPCAPVHLWRHVARGTIDPGVAARALIAAFTPAEIGALVLDATEQTATHPFLAEAPAQVRERTLSLQLLDHLDAHGLMRTLADTYTKFGREPYRGVAILRAWRAGALQLDDVHMRALTYATLVVIDRPPTGVQDLLRTLPPEWKARIVADNPDAAAEVKRVLAA